MQLKLPRIDNGRAFVTCVGQGTRKLSISRSREEKPKRPPVTLASGTLGLCCQGASGTTHYNVCVQLPNNRVVSRLMFEHIVRCAISIRNMRSRIFRGTKRVYCGASDSGGPGHQLMQPSQCPISALARADRRCEYSFFAVQKCFAFLPRLGRNRTHRGCRRCAVLRARAAQPRPLAAE